MTPVPMIATRWMGWVILIFRDLGSESDESAKSSDRFADDQRVHLSCAFVGVEGLRVRDEAADMMVQEDAIGAEQLTRPADSFTHPDRAHTFRKRSMFVPHETLILQLREPEAQRLRRADVAQHPEQQILHKLKSCNRAAELNALLGVAQ